MGCKGGICQEKIIKVLPNKNICWKNSIFVDIKYLFIKSNLHTMKRFLLLLFLGLSINVFAQQGDVTIYASNEDEDDFTGIVDVSWVDLSGTAQFVSISNFEEDGTVLSPIPEGTNFTNRIVPIITAHHACCRFG